MVESKNKSRVPFGFARFTHDCDRCERLGGALGHDLYICHIGASAVLGPSLIARYGNEGEEYSSLTVGVLDNIVQPPRVFKIARRRAEMLGYL